MKKGYAREAFLRMKSTLDILEPTRWTYNHLRYVQKSK